MDDIDSILNDFDQIYAKADKENDNKGAQGKDKSLQQTQGGDDDDELAVMDFMSAPSAAKYSNVSMESNDNLDDEINSFMRKNSKTENVAVPPGSKGKKKSGSKNKKSPGAKAKKSVTISEDEIADMPYDEELVEEIADIDAIEDVVDDDRYALSDDDEDGEADMADDVDYDDDMEEEEEQERDPSPQAQQKVKPYQTDMTRPLIQYGKTKLTYGEAKLYGLLDENGELKLQKNDDAFARNRSAVLHSRAMAERKEPKQVGRSDEDKEMTFKPTRSKEAIKAMKSRGCGYDFLDNVNSGSSGAREEKIEKRKLEAQEKDYEARLDRLKCPTCNKFQAFAEFIERKRSCQNCNVRYVANSTSHPQAYARKQREAEQRKKERLKKIEDELYPPQPKPVARPPGNKSLVDRTNELMTAQKERAKFEIERKKQAQIDALAKARAPPRPVTQPVRVSLADEKPSRPVSANKLNATTVPKNISSTKNKFSGAVKQSVMSEKFNKLIQYPRDSPEVK